MSLTRVCFGTILAHILTRKVLFVFYAMHRVIIASKFTIISSSKF